jgi:hypothetical protein
MRWTDLKIGKWNVKMTPITDTKESYQRCDKDGNALKYIPGTLQKGTFINEETGETFEDAFYLIDGQVSAGFERTKEISDGEFKEVELDEAEDLKGSHLYLVEGDALLEDLVITNKAVKFWFSNGRTSQYLAYLYPSKLYKGFMFLKLGTTKISDKIADILDVKEQQAKLKEVMVTVQGISKTKLVKAL